MFVGVLLLLLLPEEATGLLPRPLPPKRSLEASLLRPPTSPLSTNYSHYHHHHQQQQQHNHDQSSPPLVIGMDEAGTGAIAGPIVAAAVWLDTSFDEQAELAAFDAAAAAKRSNPTAEDTVGSLTSLPPPPPPLTRRTRLHDSKVLNATERRGLWLRLKRSEQLEWATGAATAARVDEVGVAAANGEAMAVALRRLSQKLHRRHRKQGLWMSNWS